MTPAVVTPAVVTPAVVTPAVEVEAVGPLVTVQDLGRPGRGDLGVGCSGAADRAALRLANRLLGNAEDLAGLEVLAGGLALRARTRVVVAVTGAPSPLRVLSRGLARPVASCRATVLAPGDRLELGVPACGLRTYVAVRGGLEPDAVLGSRSTDLLADIGPPRVRAGDVLAVGPEPPGPPPPGDAAVATTPTGGEVTLRAVPGPRDDWFTPGALAALFRRAWTVGERSDRVGVRLGGPSLDRSAERAGCELPSEGVTRGAVQVPASGQPLVFLADHPVTGGYPVVAVLLDRDVDRVAQLRPGQQLRLQRSRSPLAGL